MLATPSCGVLAQAFQDGYPRAMLDVTQILHAIEAGDPKAAAEAVPPRLRRAAQARFRADDGRGAGPHAPADGACP